ncbi:hypothetical protein PBY51_002218 [Eleginops maclovinus]|uniref:Uncharacterized protein n=1 Tax=Eleginops maclovinus TaxID=56733 RepID=A0AAN8ADL8_ELEMC|nr:hypothetical protein PBY51_002218 [Eleginops maclovinus]
MDSFTLFRGGKRLVTREEDMTVEKIGHIFQVRTQSMYLTDDHNGAIFPDENGHFQTGTLLDRNHYEVNGEPDTSGPVSQPPPGPVPVPFSFSSTSATSPRMPPPRASGHFGRAFQRSIHVAEVVGNRLLTSRMLVIKFMEIEASVEGIVAKVREALGSEDALTLIDSQGNNVLDSEGTRSSQYWRQNSRKTFVMTEDEFVEFQSGCRAKLSRKAEDSTSAQDVLLEKVVDLKQAAEGLQTIATTVRHLSEVARSHLARPGLQRAKDAIACLVCKAEKPLSHSDEVGR